MAATTKRTTNGAKSTSTKATTKTSTSRSSASATTAKKPAAKKPAAKKPAAKKPAAKKASGSKTTGSKTTTSPAAGGRSTTAAPATRLHERQPATLARQSGLALAGVTKDAVELARVLPDRVTALSQAPELVRDLPGALQEQSTRARERAARELDARLARVETRFDAEAAKGEQVVAEVRRDPRVAQVETELRKIWEQTGNTRMQVKAAWTSIRKTADVATGAALEQVGNARSHLKAAGSSVRKTADVALDASRGQARNSRMQVKAAATSARRTAGTVVDAGRQLAD